EPAFFVSTRASGVGEAKDLDVLTRDRPDVAREEPGRFPLDPQSRSPDHFFPDRARKGRRRRGPPLHPPSEPAVAVRKRRDRVLPEEKSRDERAPSGSEDPRDLGEMAPGLRLRQVCEEGLGEN